MELTDLPTELLIDIFYILPSKTLIQLASKSKSIRAIIKNPIFISKHRKNWSASNQSGYIIWHHPRNGRGSDRISRFDNDFSISEPNLEPPIHYTYTRIIGSCDGLLCLCNGDLKSAYLWNPSIGLFKELPDTRVRYKLGWYPSLYGVGFNNKTNDYKVIQIFSLPSLNGECITAPENRVYSLSSNEWRWIKFKLPNACHPKLSFGIRGTSFNGVFYYLAQEDNEWMIISFSFSDETFGKISLPSGLFTYTLNSWLSIESLNEVLAVIVHCNIAGVGMDVWVLKEVSESGIGSWNKLFNIATNDRKGSLLCFGLDGKVIMNKWRRGIGNLGKLGFWDIEKQKFVAHEINDDVRSCFTYSESLVLVRECGWKRVKNKIK